MSCFGRRSPLRLPGPFDKRILFFCPGVIGFAHPLGSSPWRLGVELSAHFLALDFPFTGLRRAHDLCLFLFLLSPSPPSPFFLPPVVWWCLSYRFVRAMTGSFLLIPLPPPLVLRPYSSKAPLAERYTPIRSSSIFGSHPSPATGFFPSLPPFATLWLGPV